MNGLSRKWIQTIKFHWNLIKYHNNRNSIIVYLHINTNLRITIYLLNLIKSRRENKNED